MPASSNTAFELFRTKRPINYYVTVIGLAAFIVGFIFVLVIRKMNGEAAFATGTLFLFFGFVFYAMLGQYLAIISVYQNKLVVKYIFPWNSSFEFDFEKLVEINSKGMLWELSLNRMYQGGQKLFLKNEKEEVCQFKCNINDADFLKLIDLLDSLR